MSIINTMIGATILVLPKSFDISGIISSSIICLIIYYISQHNGQLIAKHMKKGEKYLCEVL